LAIAETNFLVDKTAFIYCAGGLENPPIMILDDHIRIGYGKEFVQVALENMMQNRTSIVIAHRLSTIQKADVIVVMKKENCRARQS
jgi:ABC-type transport system involved in Fe-S cluster assembly fused permease/ATPase subunit